jgi:DNA primase
MAGSLDEVKQRIKARVPLDQLIGETVTLVRRGANVMACCPFHNEKSPSFHIYGDGHYYCYGCKENGDAITFVRKTRELSFIDSLKFLASKYGIEAPELEESDLMKRRRGEQTALSQMMAAAQDMYTTELRSERGVAARTYLKERGFTDENILKFGFGLTPEEGFGLVKNLRALGFREDDMIRASLAGVSAKSGRPYDFFRERLMIPIRDPHGRVIAFGGRTMVGDPAKYKNSGSTPLFDKSGVLFGLDQARDAIKDRRQAIIVEGYMDTLCLWQAGIHEVVACMGTSLTVRQLKLLYQQTKVSDVIILFDGDQAGQEQTLNKVDVVLEVPELRVRAAKLTGGDDPDTYVMKNGAEALRDLMSHAVDLLDAAIGSRLVGANVAAIPSIVTQEFVPWLAKTQDPVKKGYLVNKVSQLTGVPVDVINRQLRSFHFGAAALPGRPHKLMGAMAAGAVSSGSVSSGAEAMASGGGAAESKQTLRAVMPTRALTPVETGVLGHLYFARPGEVEHGKVVAFISKELPLEPLWELFARQIAQSYAQGQSPCEDPEVLAAFTPEEVVILGAITGLDPRSFAIVDRNKSIERLIMEQKRRNIQQSIAVLKRQVQVAATQSPQEVSVYLAEVASLNQALTALEKSMVNL